MAYEADDRKLLTGGGMTDLGAILAVLETDEKLKNAVNQGGGGWSGPTLPQTHEYRAVVTSSKLAPSNSGTMQITANLKIEEPAVVVVNGEEIPVAGRMFGYYVPMTGDARSIEKVGKTIKEFRLDASSYGGDINKLVEDLPGRTIVFTINNHGTDDATGLPRQWVRWINADVGQTLKTNVALKAGSGGGVTTPNIDELIEASKAKVAEMAAAPVEPPATPATFEQAAQTAPVTESAPAAPAPAPAAPVAPVLPPGIAS